MQWAGVGTCSEARLLAETKAMVDRMRVCEPQQSSVYGQSDFNGDITRAACIGTECGGPGMCAVDPERRRNIASPQTTNAAGAVARVSSTLDLAGSRAPAIETAPPA